MMAGRTTPYWDNSCLLCRKMTRVFFVFTANNMEKFAPELVDRFEGRFFIDLPSADERRDSANPLDSQKTGYREIRYGRTRKSVQGFLRS